MKHIIVALAAIVICAGATAQCKKDLKLYSSKREKVDFKNVTTDSEQETNVFTITQANFSVITNGNPEQEHSGAISDYSCDWTSPFKEGKSIIKSLVSDARGDAKNAIITIEGKDGKLTIWIEVKEIPDFKLKFPIDKFEEVRS